MFIAEKCKRDWPIGGKAASAAACVCVQIRGQICSPNAFGLGSVRIKRYNCISINHWRQKAYGGTDGFALPVICHRFSDNFFFFYIVTLQMFTFSLENVKNVRG